MVRNNSLNYIIIFNMDQWFWRCRLLAVWPFHSVDMMKNNSVRFYYYFLFKPVVQGEMSFITYVTISFSRAEKFVQF